MLQEDEVTGERIAADLDTILLIETGQFYNVQSERKLRHFVRDDLTEIAVRWSALTSVSCLPLVDQKSE